MENQVHRGAEKNDRGTAGRGLALKIVILALAVALIVFAGYSLRNMYRYENAISCLKDARYADAAAAFEALGEYRDAPSYLLYSRAAEAGEKGDCQTAADNLAALGGFSDSAMLSAYYRGRAYEDARQYEQAIPVYSGISLYRDAGTRLAALPDKIFERDYESARALEDKEQLERAAAAFEQLGEYKDSASRAAALRAKLEEQRLDAVYARAEAEEAEDRLTQARKTFLSISDYKDSAARAEAILETLNDRAYQAAVQAQEADDILTAYQGFAALGDYRDSADRAGALFEEAAYRSAWNQAESGDYAGACAAYEALGDYRDSAAKASALQVTRTARTQRVGEGLAAFTLESKRGLINLKNNRVTVAHFDSIGRFGRLGLARVGADGRYGFIDENGIEAVPIVYSDADPFDENGLARVRNTAGQYGYIDAAGKEVIPCICDDLSAFSDGVCVAKVNRRYYILNTEGGQVVDIAFRDLGAETAGSLSVPAFDASGRLRASDLSGRYALLGRDYQPLTGFDYDEIGEFSEGLARVRSGKAYGFIDVNGELAVPPEWPMATDFSDGCSAVRAADGRWGYIDKTGELIIPAVYESAGAFRDGRAAVSTAGIGWYLIDRTGANLGFAVVPYESALAALENGDYDTAAEGFRALGDYGDAYDQMREALYRKAVKLREAGDLSAAYPLAQSLAAEPAYKDSEALRMAIMADRLFESGDTASAWDLYAQVDEGLRRHTDEYAAMYENAEALLADERYDEAIAAFRAVGGYGDSAARIEQAYDAKYATEYAAALALLEAGQYDEAVAGFSALGAYSRAREMIQESRYRQALQWEKDGRTDEAVARMEALSGYQDADRQAMRMRADRLYASGDLAGAWEIYAALEEAYRTHAADYLARYQAALAQREAGQYDEAQAGFEALGGYEDSAEQALETRYQRADSQLKAERFDEAVTGFNSLDGYRDATDRAKECLYMKALKAERDGDPGAALRQLKALSGYRDADEQVRRIQADQLYAAGDLDGAWAIYAQLDEAYHTHDADYQARYAAAEQLLADKQYQEAADAFAAMGAYADSPARAAGAVEAGNADRYAQAQARQAAGEYDEAYDLYEALGEYQDSQQKLLEVAGQKADHLFEEGLYAEAAEVYRLLGSEKALEADYREALRLKEAGEYLAASAQWLRIRDYQDSRKQNYQMAGERRDAGDSLTAVTIYAVDLDYEDAREQVYQIGIAAREAKDYATAVAAWTVSGQYKDSGMNLTMDTYAYGDQLYAAGRYDEAAEVFRGMNGFSNTEERAQDSAYQAALAALEKGDYEDAAQRFTALGDYSESRTMVQEARYRAALAHLEAGEYEAALQGFRQLTNYRDSAAHIKAARYALAAQAYDAGRYADAAKGFEAVRDYRDAETRWRQARFMLYGEALAAARFDEAVAGFEALAAEGYAPAVQEVYRSHYLKAQSLDEAGRAEDAYREYVLAGVYEDAAARAKRHAYDLGCARRDAADNEAAVRWFEIADDDSDARDQLYKIGYFYFSVQDWPHAVNAFKTLGGYQDVSALLCRIGQYYDMQGDELNACLAYGYAGPDSEGAARAKELQNSLYRQAAGLRTSGQHQQAVPILETLARIDPAIYPDLIAVDFEAFLCQPGRTLRIGETDWKYLGMTDGQLIFVSDKVLTTTSYKNLSNWLNGAKNRYFNAEERAFVERLWIMSKNEVSRYMPQSGDRAVGVSGDIWTSTKDSSRSGYYSTYYSTYDGRTGSMGNYDYMSESNEAGVRPGLSLSRSLALYQLIMSQPERYAFRQNGQAVAYTSTYHEEYQAAQEADRLRRYRRALALMEQGHYDEASQAFTALGDYQESERMVLECAYQQALRIAEDGRDEEAIAAFEALGGYSDSASQIEAARNRILERAYQAAKALADAGRDEEAVAAFEALGGYGDSASQIEAARERIRARRYAEAAALEEAGEYASAYDIFADPDMAGYQDSPARAASVQEKAAEQKRRQDYGAAAAYAEEGRLEEALSLYEALGEYEDSAARAEDMKERIRARDYEQARQALAEGRYAEAAEALETLGDYQESPSLLTEARNGMAYEAALADALAGRLQQAYAAFTGLRDYKDSANKASILNNLNRSGRTRQLTAGVLIYEFHDLWGIANLNTNVITAAKYTRITFEEGSRYAGYGLAQVFVSGGSRSNRSGAINARDTYGYIDMNGREVIPCEYLFLSDFNSDGLCTIGKPRMTNQDKPYSSLSYYYYRALFGIVDYQGRIITEPQWRTMGEVNCDDWDNDYGDSNNWRSSAFTVEPPAFENHRIKVRNARGLWGFMDEQGKVLGEVKWLSIGDFSDGLAMVSESQAISRYTYVTKYGFIDERGQTVGEVRWDSVRDFSQGLAAVQENGLWGFIDQTNTLVIPCQYAEVNAFKADTGNGTGASCDVRTPDGRWTVIDKQGSNVAF